MAVKFEPDFRVLVRLAPDHPLRHQESLFVRTNLRSLLDHLELIKEIRSVPSGTALVAPSPDWASDHLQVAVALQPMTRIIPIEKQENCANLLLGPVPKNVNNFSA